MFLLVNESIDSLIKAKRVADRPLILTQYIFVGLMESIKLLLKSDSVLSTLILDGMPLSGNTMPILAKVNMSLQSN